MLFNSYKFIGLFLPAVLLGYWVLGRWSRRTAVFWLAAASYVFYIAGEPIYPWLIVVSIAFNYAVGTLLARTSAQGGVPRRRQWLLALGIGGNLTLLGYMKYYNFVRGVLHDTAGVPLPHHSVILPIGISFFTFTQIAFLVDVYRQLASDRDPLSYFLFVTFFPHLIAGPILHHKEMMPQFSRTSRENFIANFGPGLAMFSVGLFKKTMIADPLAQTATLMFGSLTGAAHLNFVSAWMTALAYTGQIYFDFSGYSDMAVGIAKMFAIDLPVNFNSPYKADSIIDFWRRWHITLSRFLRDYLYIPLGGSRKGESRRFVNLFLTMLLGGLWHGAGWMFLVWGALHGTYLVINHLSRLRWPQGAPIPKLLSQAVTFVCVVFAWIPFRATSLAVTWTVWKGMLGMNGFEMPDLPGARILATHLHLAVVSSSLGVRDLTYIVAALLLAFGAPNSQQWLSRLRLGLDSPGYHALPTGEPSRWSLRPTLGYAVVLGVLLGLAVRGISGYSEFIYFHF